MRVHVCVFLFVCVPSLVCVVCVHACVRVCIRMCSCVFMCVFVCLCVQLHAWMYELGTV